MKQLISIQEACRITSLSRTTLWKKIKNDQFPRPVRLDCDRKAFLASEIEEWIDRRVADRDRQPAQ
jgi:prophage regulatory protein